jgi:hypothetical protein
MKRYQYSFTNKVPNKKPDHTSTVPVLVCLQSAKKIFLNQYKTFAQFMSAEQSQSSNYEIITNK